jgi:membrane-associated phospholipid phosphatase
MSTDGYLPGWHALPLARTRIHTVLIPSGSQLKTQASTYLLPILPGRFPYGLLRRVARLTALIRMRLSARGYLGAQMGAGALALIGASWLFGGVSEDVLTGDPLTLVDVYIAEWLHAHAAPRVTEFMLCVSNLHGVVAISAYAAVLGLYLVWKRDWYWLACLGAVVPGGMVLNLLMKFAFHRARPSFDEPLLTLMSYSFPSGHVAGATLFYGVLGAMLVSKTDMRWWKGLMAILAIVILVALSRLYLGVHYLSDVLAAFAEAVAWLSLCLMSIHTWWPHRGKGRATARRGLAERHAMTMPAAMKRAGVWLVLAFGLNLIWEIAQVRLYTLWSNANIVTVAWALLHCTAGDVVIASASFTLAGMVLRRPDWPAPHPWLGSVIIIIGATAYTAWSEWYNVYRVGSWAYTASMPTIFGIGLSPLLQWLILPPLLVLAYRRFGAPRPGQQSLVPMSDSTGAEP